MFHPKGAKDAKQSLIGFLSVLSAFAGEKSLINQAANG